VRNAVDKHFNTFKICQLSKESVCVGAIECEVLTCYSKGHVAQGAILVRTCAPFIIRRPILRSKAVTTFVEVTDSIRRSPIFEDLYIKKDKFLGEQWCFAAQWLAKQVSSRPYIYVLYEANDHSGNRSQDQTCQ
jgi:hypothetical protein